MTINEYQQKAHETADYPHPYMEDGFRIPYVYPVMGLVEEAGEVSGKFAKAVRDNDGVIDDEIKSEIVKELGDVAWMLAECSTVIGVSLEEVLQKNIEKLASRKQRNVIHGSGDNR